MEVQQRSGCCVTGEDQGKKQKIQQMHNSERGGREGVSPNKGAAQAAPAKKEVKDMTHCQTLPPNALCSAWWHRQQGDIPVGRVLQPLT